MVQLDTVTATAERLCEVSPRLWENEAKAAAIIRETLDEQGTAYTVQDYDVVYPTFPTYELMVDGKAVDCLPSGLQSGTITEKTIIDNVHVAFGDFAGANLNFNPFCPGLSKQTFYDAPALTVSRQDIPEILAADSIDGRLEVDREHFTSQNILVGNTDDPDVLVFTHYDSWWGGFLDNAFSVSLLMHLLPELDLDRMLIVFAGSEEFSHEDPYWCYGYRQFENRYHDIIEACDRIAVVDTVGRGETQVNTDRDLLNEALILNDPHYVDKTELLIGQFNKVMEVYHSPLDTRDALTHGEDAIQTVTDYFAEWM